MTALNRIMLVEDDLDIALLAQIALEQIGGFEFCHFAAGPVALREVAGIAPDLIILDYRMPDMTGLQVIDALKATAETSAIPVIFMTASVMPAHVNELIDRGAIAVIPKPFDPLTLADTVRAHWSVFHAARQVRD